MSNYYFKTKKFCGIFITLVKATQEFKIPSLNKQLKSSRLEVTPKIMLVQQQM